MCYRTHAPGPFDSVNSFANYSNQAPRATIEHIETSPVRKTASPDKKVTSTALTWGPYTPSNPPPPFSCANQFAPWLPEKLPANTKHTESDLRHEILSSHAGSITEDEVPAADFTETAFEQRTSPTSSDLDNSLRNTAMQAPSTIIADDRNAIELGWFPSDDLRPLKAMKTILKLPYRDPQNRWWAMHHEYHGDVSRCLKEFDLHYTFNEVDSREAYLLDERSMRIPGRFECHHENCRDEHEWESQAVGILIRRYIGQKYNARVYWQACGRCHEFTQPDFDIYSRNSYVEHIVHAIKVWSGIPSKMPTFPQERRGRHRSDLCWWCRSGRCPLFRPLPASEKRNKWSENSERQKKNISLDM